MGTYIGRVFELFGRNFTPLRRVKAFNRNFYMVKVK